MKEKCDTSLKEYTFSDEDRPFGLTYGQWTTRWWQWAFSSPKAFNPILDYTGVNAGTNQCGPVWFLGGTFGEGTFPERRCFLPDRRAVLFPVINYETNPLEEPKLKTRRDLVSNVVRDMDDIVKSDASLDGMKLPVHRIQSDPKVFSLNIHEDNGIGIIGGSTVAAADGYWVFLKPLSPGKHEIFFKGSCANGARTAGAHYLLEVQ